MFNEKSELVEKNYCPICEKYLEFEVSGSNEREYSKCPLCGSLERHRLTYLFFKGRYSELFNQKSIKLLHISPEKVFYNYFKDQKNIDYYPADINDLKLFESDNIEIEEKISIEKLPYPDNEFDLIYNEHILQYIQDDDKAIKEIYRVLKRNGHCIIPLILNNPLDETSENDYGKQNKIIYLTDLANKFKQYGFDVEVVTCEDILDFDFEKSLYNVSDTKIIVCKKN